MATKGLDVSIAYYSKTSKDHPIGTIIFRDNMGSLIDSDRIELEVEAEVLRFRKSEDGHGLRLSNSKIQLWSLAWIAELWEGQYPLKFDIESGCYCIHKCDMQDPTIDKKEGLRLGIPVQYTSHKGISNTKQEVAEATNDSDSIVPSAPQADFQPVERVLLSTLADQIIALSNDNRITSVAETIKLLLSNK